MTVVRASVLLVLLGCRQPVTVVEPVAATVAEHPNQAASLVATIDRVIALEVVALDDRRVLGTCDAALLESIRAEIRGGVGDGLTATPPAWPIAIRLVLDHGEPFVAHLVGHQRLRLCPEDPWRDCVADPVTGAIPRDVGEVSVPFELFGEVARIVGVPPRLEYRTPEPNSPPL